MLQKIRDRIQGWFAGVIIAIIAGAFMLFGVEYYLDRGASNGKTVATVNGTKITEQQLNRIYHQLSRHQQLAQAGVPLSDQEQLQLKQVALREIITRMALTNAAADAGLNVSLGEVKQLVMQDPGLQVNGQFSPQRFQQLLYANQTTELQFLNRIRSRLLTNQMALGIQNSAFVLPEELALAYRLIHQRRSFGYFVLPKSKFQSGVTISAQEINHYYTQHTDQYKTPEKVKISYLLLSPKSLEKNIQISQTQLQSYYTSNKASYSVPKRWNIARITIALPAGANQRQITAATTRMQKIQAQLKKGRSFTTLMKQTTNGQTATTMWINENQASTTLMNVLSTMRLKQISTPFHTSNGINIIQLLGKKPAKTRSFDAVKAQIKQALLQQQVAQLLSKKIEQLSNLTYTNPTTLQVAARALGVSVQTSPWVTRSGTKTGLLSNPAVLAVAFSDDVLKDGDNSNPVTVKDGSVVVLRVVKHLPSSVKALSSVSQQIKQQLLNKKVEAKLGLKAYEIASVLAGGTAPQVLAEKYGLKWIMKKQVSRKDKTVPVSILETAFSTIPANSKKITGVNSLLLANGDYAVVKVFSYKNGDFSKALKKPRKQLSSELANLWGQLSYKFYAKAVISRAKINKK